MALILLTWLYVLITASIWGIGFSKRMCIPQQNLALTTIFGLFAITILASVWAFFGPIHLVFHLILLISTIIFGWWFRYEWLKIIKNSLFGFTGLSIPLKTLFTLSSLIILAQSASVPFIFDNETYYIQTIKWLNAYGFVPGLANLHLFLGQTSGWHITQSVYTFSFLYDRCNDLNGLLLIMVNFWSFQKLQSYFSNHGKLDLVFGLLPLCLFFLLQFVSAPSPDLPVYLIAMMLFSIFTEEVAFPANQFKLLMVLVLFAVYIKITAVVLVILPMYYWYKQNHILKYKLHSIQLLSALVFILFVIKNVILTGYPFFPLTMLPYPGADFVVPKDLMLYFFSHDMMHSFYLPHGALETASLHEIILHYFGYNGIGGIIGISTLLLLLVTPFVMHRYYAKQNVYPIYGTFIILLVLLCCSSPQYRFYLYFTIFFGLLLIAQLVSGKKIILALLSLSVLGSLILVVIPLSYSNLTGNSLLNTNSVFHFKNLLIPEPNSKFNGSYSHEKTGNLAYQFPQKTAVFWMTGNAELPAVSREQLNYFKVYFNVIPQYRGNAICNGFYAQKSKSND